MTAFTLSAGKKRTVYICIARARINYISSKLEHPIPYVPTLVVREDDGTKTFGTRVDILGPSSVFDSTAPGGPPPPFDRGPTKWIQTTAELLVTL